MNDRTLPSRAYSIIQIKSVQEEQRVIEGIASTPTVDRQGDIVESMGAKFSLPIPLLFQHRSTEPVGEVTRAKAGKDGISFVAKFAQLADPGRLKDRLDEAWQSVKIGLVKGVSIGFVPIEYSFIDDGVRFIEWDWLELSLVTIPANQEATIQTVKSVDAELLAAIGREQTGSKTTRPGATGKALPVVKSSNAGGRPMARKTISEQLAAFEAARAAKAARMTEIMDDAGEKGETLDAAQTEEYDGLGTEVKSIDEHLVRLKDQEKINIAAATTVSGTTAEVGSAARAGQVVTSMQRQLPKGIPFARYAMCLMAAKGSPDGALKIAESRYPDMGDMHMVLRAAVSAGTTSDPAWAAPLVQYQNLVGDFIEFLRPQTIVGKFGTGNIPALRAVPFNIRVPRGTGPGQAYWVGEGKPKPLTSMMFDAITLRWAKVATIAVITQELARFSSPSAEALVRDELAKAIAERIDLTFVDPTVTAIADTRPASITNGVAAIPSTGDPLADIDALYTAFITSGLPLTSGVFITNNTTALALSMRRNPLGQKEHPDLTMDGGTLEGLPVIASQYLAAAGTPPKSLLILVAASEIMLADDGQATVDASTEASLEMDTAPTGASAPLTAPSQTLVSLWQTNSIGIRAERFINWTKRNPGACQYVSGVAYTTAGATTLENQPPPPPAPTRHQPTQRPEA